MIGDEARLDSPREGWSELELKAAMLARLRALADAGARHYIPRGDLEYAFGVGLRMLVLRRLVSEDAGVYRPAPEGRTVLAYYANSIAHLPGAAKS